MRILLYKTGDTAPEVVASVGDYLAWFERAVAGLASLVLHPAVAKPRPALDGVDGIIVTGSPASLVTPEPWMDECADFLRGAASAGVPVLGTCFGHQLLGRAFGGAVRINPRGWEVGTHSVALTDAGRRDPLFMGLPDVIAVNQSHRDEVEYLGDGVVQLARGEHSENQSIAVGDHVRGVQFHPEMSAVIIRRLIQPRHRLLVHDCVSRSRPEEHHPDELLRRASDTPHAEQIVRNFVQHFAAKA